MLLKEDSRLSELISIMELLIKVYHNYSYIPITPPPLTLPVSACSAFAYFIAMSNDLMIPLTSFNIAESFLAVSISSSSSA
nr:MAG TPA: hypothetical protein [Bacteriophage sp.]